MNTISKNNLRRILSLSLILAALLSCLSGCGSRRKEIGDYTVNTDTVMKVNGYKVSFDEYRCFYLSAMADLDGGDSSIWREENAPLDKLKEMTESSIRRKYALMSLIDEYDIKLTDTDRDEINETVAYYIEQYGGEAGFRQWLASGNMTGRIFREQYTLVYYYDEYLRDVLFTGIDDRIKVDDKTVSDDVRENFYHYTWIFIPFDEKDNYLDNAKKADDAFAELEAGGDFYAVADKYSEWTGNETVGIYAAKGEKLELLEETALELEIGEYSRVLAMGEGHAILMRLPMDEKYINDHFDDFVYQSATRRYNIMLDELAKQAEVKYTDYYDTLTMDILKNSKEYFVGSEQ